MIFDVSTYCPELETPISATAAALRPTDRDNSMKLVSAVKLTLQIASSLVVVSMVLWISSHCCPTDFQMKAA